jgi:hypothetical protein
MLLGLWVLGGFLMVLGGLLIMAGASFTGADADTSNFKILPLSLLPGIVYIFSTYDGSLGALLIVTFLPLIIWIVRVIKQSLQPR